MPLSDKVKKTVKTFLDVVIERVGDATSGFIILLTLSFTGIYVPSIRLCRSDRFMDAHDRTSADPALGAFERRIKVAGTRADRRTGGGEIIQA